ncbi:MAG: haloacid dehalogenase-like hydrolase [Candidatus Symbiothrix sp.]|nr:haloacid dehalogenase-like hydrolase [Candidatus Symbiothrix sp.]
MKPNKSLPTIALIYDFDGTLSPGNMQDFGFIQAIGKNPNDFWKKCMDTALLHEASTILAYMKVMLDEAKEIGFPLTKEVFRQFGAQVELFQGVKEWFSLINDYGRSKGVVIEHYINSSGIKEIIEGTPIALEFKKIYACSFFYNADGIAEFPAVAIDFTTKTQFLFKINKGIDSITDNQEVNRYTPEKERPIPFKRMIYFGDGETDIPCMQLIKQQGGHSIAVYNPGQVQKKTTAEKLIAEDRVNFVCPADYSKNSELFRVVTDIITKMRD